MRCDVRSAHVNLNPTFRDYVEQRLDRSLGKMRNRVDRITIHLDDVNGPKRGSDKRCLAEAHLVRAGTLVTQVTAGDYRTAVDEAADRLAMRVRKQLERRREVRRYAGRRTPAQPEPQTESPSLA